MEVNVQTRDTAVQTEQKSGADLLIELLKEQEVELIFGYPGGAVLPIYDALYKNPIRHVLARHEQGAIHAAEGYARVSGKTGVVLATSGPGATNLVTGIADAMLDSLPLVVFTGQVATTVIGTDAFQEADIVSITQPITKHNYQVKNAEDLPRIVKEAFYIASTGRPDPWWWTSRKTLLRDRRQRFRQKKCGCQATSRQRHRTTCRSKKRCRH